MHNVNTYADWPHWYEAYARWLIQLYRTLHGSLVQVSCHVAFDEEIWLNEVFSYLGLTKILQSYNGREFVNEIVKETLTLWPGQVVIINGCPRHSQSQGLVEKGNHCVEMQIQAMKKEWRGTGNVPWSDWLPLIQCMLVMVVRKFNIDHFLIHSDNLNT